MWHPEIGSGLEQLFALGPKYQEKKLSQQVTAFVQGPRCQVPMSKHQGLESVLGPTCQGMLWMRPEIGSGLGPLLRGQRLEREWVLERQADSSLG